MNIILRLILTIYLILNFKFCKSFKFEDSLEKFISSTYDERDFNPLFIEEFNEIMKNPNIEKRDDFLRRLRSGQWFALRQQVEQDSAEMGLKRVVGMLPVNPFVGNIFAPAINELELADNMCEALMEMRKKGLAEKIGLKIAKDGIIRQKFCSDAAELYFNGLRPRPTTVAQKQNEANKLGNIEYFDFNPPEKISNIIKIPEKFHSESKLGNKSSYFTNSQEAEFIAKQTLLRDFIHIVKLLHLETLRKDPLRLREYFPGTITQLRQALESDNPELVALRLLRLGPTSDLLEEFIKNHRGRRDFLLMKVPEKSQTKQLYKPYNDSWSELISNSDLSGVSLALLEHLAYKHVALTPMIRSTLKKACELIEREREESDNRFIPHIIDTLNLLPDLVKGEIRVYLELNTKSGSNRINTIEKIKSMINALQPVVRTFNHFDEEEIKNVLKNKNIPKNDLNYYSRTISKIVITLLDRRRRKVKEDDPEFMSLFNDELSISVNSLIETIRKMNNRALGALVDHIERVVPNFTNKNMYSRATPKQREEILSLIKMPSSPEVSKQFYTESILRPLLQDAIPNQEGLLDKFIKGFYILMVETGIRLQLFMRNGSENQISNEIENRFPTKKVFPEDNLRHNSDIWIESIKNLLEETLFPFELASRRLLQYMKECKLGMIFGLNDEDLEEKISEINEDHLQKLLDNFDSTRLNEKDLNLIFLEETGNMLVLPNRRYHIINYIFNKDAESLFKILKDKKLNKVLISLVRLLERIQIPKKEIPIIEGPYWDRSQNKWINAEKLKKNEVEVKFEPQKVTDLPITREQEWERIAIFSKWSEYVKGIPMEFIPHGFKFSFGLYSNFIYFCQRGIRELAYRLIFRDKPTSTEPEGKYWEYLPRNKYSIVINADNSKEREEKVLSFCNAVYISVYSEKGIPKEYRKNLPASWSKESDKYEKEGFITPQNISKQERYRLDNVNEQWAFIAKEAQKPGIFTAPTLPIDSSLLGDVWRNLYIEEKLATSSVNEIELKISILTEMCSKAIRDLKKKKDYYGQQLYAMTYDNEMSIETFCHDTARRWFKNWPSEISEEMLLMKTSSKNQDERNRETISKPFDRTYLRKNKDSKKQIREGFSKNKQLSPVLLEDFNTGRGIDKSKLGISEDRIPDELCENSIRNECKHKKVVSSISYSSNINLPLDSKLRNESIVNKLDFKGKYKIEPKKNLLKNKLSYQASRNILDIIAQDSQETKKDMKLKFDNSHFKNENQKEITTEKANKLENESNKRSELPSELLE